MAQSVSFQFQYGTIKTPKYIVKFSPVNDFNSIMVQLKLSLPSPKTYLPSEFQFHNGTIKTKDFECKIYTDNGFQFHNGTIKTL